MSLIIWGYVGCHCAECCGLFIVMLDVIMLSVVILNVVNLSVLMLNVMAPSQDKFVRGRSYHDR